MVISPSQSEQDTFNTLLQRVQVLDLEASHQGKILKLGASLGGLTLAHSESAASEGALIELDKLAEGAN
jgi:hypothetical protein